MGALSNNAKAKIDAAARAARGLPPVVEDEAGSNEASAELVRQRIVSQISGGGGEMLRAFKGDFLVCSSTAAAAPAASADCAIAITGTWDLGLGTCDLQPVTC